MPLVKDQIRQLSPASTGNQTFTGSLGGLTPTAAKFLFIQDPNFTTAKTVTSRIGIGFTDGTTDVCVAIQNQNGLGTTNTKRRQRLASNCIEMTFVGSSAAEYTASFVSFQANSVTVNWGNIGATQYYVICILYAGVQAQVGNVSCSGVDNDPVVETTSGMTPRFIELHGVGLLGDNLGANHTKLDSGWACLFEGGINQGCFGGNERNNQGTSQAVQVITNNRVSSHWTGANNLSYTTEATNITSGSFTLTTRDYISGNDEDVIYLALETDVDEVNVIDVSNPNSNGNFAYTGLELKPDHVFMMGSGIPTINVLVDQNFDMECRSYCQFNVSQSDSVLIIAQNTIGTSNTDSDLLNEALYNVDGVGTTLLRATLVSFDTDGWTLNFVNSTTTAYLCVGFKEAAPSAVLLERSYPRGNERGITRGVI